MPYTSRNTRTWGEASGVGCSESIILSSDALARVRVLAARGQQVNGVNKILSEDGTTKGETALHVAAAAGEVGVEAVELLISRRAKLQAHFVFSSHALRRTGTKINRRKLVLSEM